jgi:Mce-associated membrane protein
MADKADETDARDVEDHESADAGETPEIPESDESDESGSETAGSETRLARWRRRATPRFSRTGAALTAAAALVVALGGLAGWLGYLAYHKHESSAKRDLFVRVARQGAVNLTTINYTQVDADVQRIVDLSTGAFRDDFEQRSKPFIDVVKAAQSKSEGTVTDAGLESERGDSAQVLVAISVKSRTAGGEEAPREWRMRIEVRSVGSDAKVSNVVFVP